MCAMSALEKIKKELKSKDIEITPEVIEAGVSAYFGWRYAEEDIEALVAGVYYRMGRNLLNGRPLPE